MRRFLGSVAAVVLSGVLAGGTLAANAGPRSFFQGDFDLYSDTGVLLGHATAQLFAPTSQRLVPGSYDFKGAAGNPILESHAQIGTAHFWYDAGHWPAGATVPGGYVARGEGVECVYTGPNEASCYEWAVQFVDNVDPSVPDEVMFDGWWGTATQFAGEGTFTLKFSGVES